jgi:nicotinamide riboside kinase
MGARAGTSFIICVTGSESTGKTSLATALAERLDAPLVTEVARDWLAARTCRREGGTESDAYGPEDVIAIAQAQEDAENAALATRAPLIIADTDQTVISVWWSVRYGESHPLIAAALRRRSPRAYLLLQPDIPWQQDPLREHSSGREQLHARYQALLQTDVFPFAEIGGVGGERLRRAVDQIALWRLHGVFG